MEEKKYGIEEVIIILAIIVFFLFQLGLNRIINVFFIYFGFAIINLYFIIKVIGNITKSTNVKKWRKS